MGTRCASPRPARVSSNISQPTAFAEFFLDASKGSPFRGKKCEKEITWGEAPAPAPSDSPPRGRRGCVRGTAGLRRVGPAQARAEPNLWPRLSDTILSDVDQKRPKDRR